MNSSKTGTNKALKIRLAERDDIETLFEIRTSVTENYQSREEIAELGITPESVAEMLATDCCAWIVEIEEQPIGFSIASATEKTIFGLFVRPDFEGRGVGRKLMQTTENWFWPQGLDEIWLLTGNNPSWRAYGFYEHLNWIPVGVESDGDFAGEMKFIKKRPDTLS